MSLAEDPKLGVGARLRAERERLDLSQDAMGSHAGKNKNTQMRYETGVNSPTAAYLHDVADLGVDIGYVLTGFPTELSDEEGEVLAYFRSASAEMRFAIRLMLTTPNDLAAKNASATGAPLVGGSNSGQVNAGPVTQGDVSFQVGSRSKGSRKPSN
ncbi:helix-turn-helix domain-containing protein [Stenotrophomonas maltophilia]|uniref:helix-turn-helix domain-containing protein n=1 Tax=Stenotrophomonas maltophilia TaxID=40324 RepID=UPI0039F664E4